MATIGYATVQLVASFEGLERQAATGLRAPLAAAGESAGKEAGTRFGNTFVPTIAHVMVAAGLYKLGQSVAHGIASAISTGLQTASFNEQALNGLQTLLGGSRKAATDLFSSLQKFSAATPFNLTDVTSAAQRLLGANIAAKDLIPTLTALGDANSAVGGSQDDLNHTVLAWSQIATRGKLSTQDLYQIANSGIPVFSELAKALHVPVSSIQDMISSGDLLSTKTLPLLRAQLSKDYGGNMAKQSKTLAGAWSNVQDTISQSLGKAFAPLATYLASKLPGWANTAADMIQRMADAVGTFVGWVRDNRSSLEQFGKSLGILAGGALAVYAASKLVALGIGLITKAFTLSGWGLILTIIGGIAFAWLQWGGGTKIVADALPKIGKVLGDIFGGLQDFGSTLGNAFKDAHFEQLKPQLKEISDALAPIAGEILQDFKDLAPLLVKVAQVSLPILVSAIKAATPFVVSFLDGLDDALKAIDHIQKGDLTSSGAFVDIMSTARAAAKSFGPMGQWVLDLSDTMSQAMYAAAAQIGRWVRQIIGTIEGIVAMDQRVVGTFVKDWNGVVSFFRDVFTVHWGAALSDAANLVGNVFGSSAKAKFNGIVSFVKGIPGKVESVLAAGFAGAGSWLYSAGKNIVQGLISGVASMGSTLVSAIVNLIPAPIRAAVEKALGIHSPSRVFMGIGRYVVQGFINGIAAGAGAISKAYSTFDPTSPYGRRAPSIPDGGMMGALAAGSSFPGQVTLIDADGTFLGRLRAEAEMVADWRLAVAASGMRATAKAGKLYDGWQGPGPATARPY